VIILAFIVLCAFAPLMWEMFKTALVVAGWALVAAWAALVAVWWIAVVIVTAVGEAWLWWRARRRRRAELLAAGRFVLEGKPVVRPVALANPEWWDLIPDDAFVPPLGWRVRKKLRLPARPLPQVPTPGRAALPPATVLPPPPARKKKPSAEGATLRSST
jgi:hypothetical protein